MPNWMVAVDGSETADLAFSTVLSLLDKEFDTLFVLVVGEKFQTVRGFSGAVVMADMLAEMRAEEEKRCKSIVVPYVKQARSVGCNCRGIVGYSSHAGELICHAVKERHIDYLAVGRRGMGTIKRMFIGSTSKYVVEHAACEVLVIKPPSTDGEREVKLDQTAHIDHDEEIERLTLRAE